MAAYIEIIKKNIVAIICGLIAIGAVVALYFPVSGYFTELQSKADARKSDYTALKGILDKQRKMPVVDPNNTGEAKPLEQFPTRAVIDAGKTVTDQVKTEAAAMLDAAVKLNEHKPLVAGALPEGRPSQMIDFRRDYSRTSDYISDQNREQSFVTQIMHAGFPPTEAQVLAERTRVEQEIRKKTSYNPQTGQPINGEQVDREVQQTLPQVADRMKKDAAEKCLVYIEPTTFDTYAPLTSLPPGTTPEPSTVFVAQVWLWIQEDIARSIASANSNSKNVTDAPVKHLVKMQLPDTLFAVNPNAPSADPTAVVAVSNDPSAALTKNFSASPTGRVTSGVFDVIPIGLRMNVEAAQIPRVLQELSRNKFLTVTNINVSTIDSSLLKAQGFFYGEKPVVQLDIQCEELLLRKWTEPLMPLRIKQTLGIAPAPAAAPQG